MIDAISIDSDEAGFTLVLAGDLAEEAERYLADVRNTSLVLRLPQDVAQQLEREVRENIAPWVAEGERERAAYDAASDEERERVLRLAPEVGDEWEAARHKADLDRKLKRESQAVWETLWETVHVSTGEPARGPEGVEPVDGSRP